MRKYVCPKCDREFPNLRGVWSHQKRHEREDVNAGAEKARRMATDEWPTSSLLSVSEPPPERIVEIELSPDGNLRVYTRSR